MSLTIRERVEQQATGLVGRDRERAVLLEMLDGPAPLVTFVHGVAGVGKSALVGLYSSEARSRGAIVVRLDCGEIEPTERGFLPRSRASSVAIC